MLAAIKLVEGSVESFEDIVRRERAIEEILLSDREPVSKVQEIMTLGIAEDEANDLVERYQIGQMAPVYYERLEFGEDYDTSEEE